jgi:hypothetical protein
MDARALLDELTRLPHGTRAVRMIQIGRAATLGDEDARRTLAELATSTEVFARTQALQALYATRDAGAVLAALTDSSRTVRLHAIPLVSLVCNDEQAVEALRHIAGRAQRKRLLMALKRRRREAVIDRFLATLSPDAEGSLLDVIPLGSAEMVARLAPGVAQKLGPDGWRRLAKHGAPVAIELVRAAIVAGPPDARLRWRLAPVAHLLAKQAPEPALALLARLFEVGEEPGSPIVRGLVGELLRVSPREVFDLLRASHESARPVARPGPFGIVRFDAVAHRLGSSRLAYLVEHASSTLSDDRRATRWFYRLGPDDRAVVVGTWLRCGHSAWGAFLLRHVHGRPEALREQAYRRWSAAAQDGHGVIAVARLDRLPTALRAREARRHFEDVPYLATRPLERVAYARLLPFGDGLTRVAPLLGHPEGEMRAAALRAVLGSVLHDPMHLNDALDLVLARAFEQDPVRQAMLDALAGLPVRLFAVEHLERVGRITRQALDAADLSTATAAAAERLVARLFRVDAAWAAPWLTRILEARGSVSALGLGDGLLPRDVRALDPALTKLAQTWAERERAAAVLWLATSLGAKRLRHAPSLLGALETLVTRLPFVGVAAAALSLLRREAPRRFAELVPALLADDRSFALLADVARFVSATRQDLLFLLLGEGPTIGRFATGRSHLVVDFGLRFGRWSGEAQTRYQRQLVALVSQEKVDTPTARFAIERLARLAFTSPAPLVKLATDERGPAGRAGREIAVRALGWVDGPAGLAELFAALGDDRARWAIYALRRLLAELPRRDILARLRAAPMQKVTVAKEVVRLIGELGGADGFAELLALDRPELHRDVRIALLRAMWDHLDRPEAWTVIERAVDDPDWVLASRVAEVPLVHLSDASERRLGGMFGRLLRRPETEARSALLERAAWLPLRDVDRTFFAALLAHMGSSPAEASLAASAVVARMLADEVDVVGARVEELVPRRRTLLAILPALRPTPYAPAYRRALALQMLRALAKDARVVPLRVELAGHLCDSRELAELFTELARRDELHADAMVAAAEALKRCVHPELVELALAGEKDARLRRLAVAALVLAARPGRGWSDERRQRLEGYRADASPFVAGAAELVFPPDPLRRADPALDRSRPGA